MDGSTWFRVTARVGHGSDPPDALDTESRIEIVTDVLRQAGSPAVERRDPTTDEEDATTLLAAYPSMGEATDARDLALSAGATYARVDPVGDDGLDAWRPYASTYRTGPFRIVPPWLVESNADADGHLLVVDPVHSFGSGSHPTSRLVLGELADVIAPGVSVLDVGCGSGILSVGAALLGAASVHGIDVDPLAPEVTRTNAERNGMAGVVTASNATLAEVAARGETFDVVVANILASVLVELASDLAAVTARGGCLVVSGLLADRWARTIERIVDGTALVACPPRIEEGWVSVRLDHLG